MQPGWENALGQAIRVQSQETARLAEAIGTAAHIDRYMSVVVDKRVRISAAIRSRIDGMAVLEGADAVDLRALAAFLLSGPLIVPLVLIDTHVI